jgi:Putative metallopeptidase
MAIKASLLPGARALAVIATAALLAVSTSSTLLSAPFHEAVTVDARASEAPAMPQPLDSRACAGAPESSHAFKRGVTEAAGMLAGWPRLKGMSQMQREERVEFVVGNLLFVLGHEAGHAVIREMGVPVVGREEDAADFFSTLLLLTCEEGFGNRVLANAALGWFLSHRRERSDQRGGHDQDEAKYYDEHGMDLQRAYNVVCLMVGSDREKFASLADAAKLPRERQATCEGDYLNAKWSWDQLLQSHLRNPGQARTAINIVYGPGHGKHDAHAALSQQMKLLETIADGLSGRFAWRAPISLEMQTCGDANARFEFRTRKVVVCYELADEFFDLHRRYGHSMSLSPDAKAAATHGRANIASLKSSNRVAAGTEIALRPTHRARSVFTTVATAGPRGQVPERFHYIDRASQNHDNGSN